MTGSELAKLLRRAGVAMRQPTNQRSIDAFGLRFGKHLPAAMGELLLSADGSAESLDRRGFRLWPLEDIAPLKDTCFFDEAVGQRGYEWFVFADYMVSSHGYAVDLGSKEYGAVFLVDGAAWHGVAKGIEEFVIRMIHEPDVLLVRG